MKELSMPFFMTIEEKISLDTYNYNFSSLEQPAEFHR